MEISLYSAIECEKIAEEAHLRYVNNAMPGISRSYSNNGFRYDYQGKRIVDPFTLKRIEKLAIPPAYHDVWICPFANGHIQATGRDNKNRKQYRYHPLWQKHRQQQKFHKMLEFGQSLPFIRQHLNHELNKKPTMQKQQIICAVIYLLDKTSARIGNSIYEKENKSYGLTTLRKKHLSFHENRAILHFEGKNSKPWHIDIKEKKLLRVLRRCEEIPGYNLFKYHDEAGDLNVVTSQDINHYLQELTQQPFTAKDFRTWIACRETLCRLIHYNGQAQTSTQIPQDVIKEVALLLGHTVNVCQKHYIYPEILEWWQQEKLRAWASRNKSRISACNDDELLLYWLKKSSQNH